MFRDNLYYHTLCYGGAIGVTGTCFFIEVNGQLFSNVHFDFDSMYKMTNYNMFFVLKIIVYIYTYILLLLLCKIICSGNGVEKFIFYITLFDCFKMYSSQ